MNCVAIIPARGGSKGVPRKNILPIAGKPLIGWTIEAALSAEHVGSVVVSTDDAEIAAISQSFGASVVWRPAEISGDLASSEAALLHAIDSLFPNGSTPPLFTVFLQCTAPLINCDDVDGTVQAAIQGNADTAVAVSDFHYFLWKSNRVGDFVGINHEKAVRKMRQEREPQYLETGSVYVMKTEGFRQHKHRFFGKTAHYVVPRERVLEIDDPIDFKVAEVLLAERSRQLRADSLPRDVNLLVFDFDGVFTDDSVIVRDDGSESVICSRADGMGIEIARKAGIPMLIISKEQNPVVMRRAEKLNIPCLHGIDNKYSLLDEYLRARQISWESVVYVGNDINDLECIEKAGCGVAVANAIDIVKRSSKIVLDRAGGQHAVRELIDLILSRR